MLPASAIRFLRLSVVMAPRGQLLPESSGRFIPDVGFIALRVSVEVLNRVPFLRETCDFLAHDATGIWRACAPRPHGRWVTSDSAISRDEFERLFGACHVPFLTTRFLLFREGASA